MKKSTCFHCYEDIPQGSQIFANIETQHHQVCCYGCKAVAEFINEQGYCDFYEYRGESQPSSKAKISDEKWLEFDQDVNFSAVTQTVGDSTFNVTLNLQGMYCSACGWLIDKHLRGLQGIKNVKLNTITKLLKVEFDLKLIKLSQILTAINYLGYFPSISQSNDNQEQEFAERKSALKRLVVAGFGMMFIMTLSVPLYGSEYSSMDDNIKRFFLLVSLLVATAVFFYSGKVFIRNAYRDLTNKHLGMDVPVALSITLAYVASTWNVLTKNGEITYFDSMVMFVFFLLAGRFVEMTVRHQGMSTDDALGSMIPTSVNILRDNIQESIPYDKINKGDVLLVQAGDVIAIDGKILSGSLKIDESMITGESESVNKQIKDTVMAGSVVNSGTAQIKSTAIGDETILASLSQLLENAQLQKPKTLLLVDKLASWFVATVLLLAAGTATYYSMQGSDKTMVTVLAVLVATCPCALSLATPAALTAASVKLMKKGVLINNLDSITKVGKINQWFFDKTGTLTEPFMSLIKCHCIGDLTEHQAIQIMAALEHNSAHPIASAFNDFYDKEITIQAYQQMSNRGVQATINHDVYKAGTKLWCDKNSSFQLESNHTVVYLSKNNQLVAVFELENKLRKGSKQLVEFLKKRGHYLAIISGDKKAAVKTIADKLQISNHFSGQTPEQKINLIHQQQALSKATVMIGDGVNDAPVLAQSDVSISFNQGTQLARAASDLIIMGNSLKSIESLLSISHKTNNIIKQNIFWALIYNLSVTPLAIMGLLTPWMAAIGMSVSSLFVVLNAKRILLK
ncbi:MAG: heavy metal translocating P-type ATPase [Marinicellaceae bacterium]